MAFTRLLYHVVFSTKERRPFLDKESMPRLRQYVSGIVREREGEVLAGDGADDHLHLALHLPPTEAVADLVRVVKTNSSKWIRSQWTGMQSFGWQDSYSAFTVSPSVLPNVHQYILDQREHHKKSSFEQELRALLEKHGIAYDERYL